MKNYEVAELLERLSLLTEASGDDRFKAIAYRRASTSVRNLDEDVSEVWKRGGLREIPFVGEGIAKKIEEYLRTGHISLLEKLEKSVPEGAVELMQVPGIGPRIAFKLSKDFGVKNVADLRRRLESKELGKALGPVLAQRILESVEKMQSGNQRMLIVEAVYLARSLGQYFDGAGIKVEFAGSLRRGSSTVGDIDLLTLDQRGTKHLLEYAQVARNIESGTTRTSVLLKNAVQVDIRVVKEEEYGAALLYFTGSKEHSIALRNIALDKRWKLNEYGIFDNQTGARIAGRTETEVYQKLGLEYIPPELREARGEIEAAHEGRLPNLVTTDQLRGDLQVHSTWSDGSEGIEEMAAAAMKRGYEYMAFTDHSISVGVANGLNAVRFEKQWKAIDELNEKLRPFRVLKGVEAEVKSDGSLDFDVKFFEGFDFVGASIHQSYRQSPEKLTMRALKALAHPSVDVLFHPTNRLIGRREGNRIDLPAVIKAAKENGKMLEIDGTPNRLDLDEIWARRAMEEGVDLIVDSDAHSSAELESVEYGVTVARRAWLEAGNVVNTLPLDQFLKRIQR